MGQLKATLVLSKYSLLATLRSPTSVVFSIAFPIFFIIIFGSLVGDKGGPIKVAVSPGCDTANPIYRTVEGLGVIKLVKGLTAAEIAAEMKQGTIGTELMIVADGSGGSLGAGGGFGLVFSLFGLGIFMGIGFIISGVVQNEHSVTPVANTLTLPQILLCGLFFPIESYPPWLQHFCNMLPLTFFVDGLRDIAFDGLHTWQLPVQVGGLLVWTVVIGVWAVKAFKWE